jgi:hypothetical protein
MNGYAQTVDLTEITSVMPLGTYNKNVSFKDEELKTEFAFWLAAPGHGKESFDEAVRLGMNHVASMNNWWPSHCGQERELKLYWKHLPGKKNLEKPPKQFRWCWSGHHYGRELMGTVAGQYSDARTEVVCQSLAGSGCGFKLIDDSFLQEVDYKCDLRARSYYKFFTLIRMPLELNEVQRNFMKEYHYHLLSNGKLAAYWVNGWQPKEYSIKKEYEFFNTNATEWHNGGSGY